MSFWSSILIEMEEAWHESEEYKYFPLSASANEYKFARDSYKARRIYEQYGVESFRKFIEQHPHMSDLIEYVPCERLQDAQCTIFCHNYKNGGCKDATE